MMQSDGDVVLDSFNRTYRDKWNILGQIYQMEYVRMIIMATLIL